MKQIRRKKWRLPPPGCKIRYTISDEKALNKLGIKHRNSRNRYWLDEIQARIFLAWNFEKTKNNRIDNKLKDKTRLEIPEEFLNVEDYVNQAELSVGDAKVLYYDVETSLALAYVFGPGYEQNVLAPQIKEPSKIMCICYKWGGEDQVYALIWNMDNHTDEDIIREFVPLLDQADYIVAHNGIDFDIRVIRTRALLNRILMRYDYVQHDTKRISKKYFRFKDNSLNGIAFALGIGEKDKMQFSDWVDVMEGNSEALNKMVEYCKNDVALLEEVHLAMSVMTKTPIHLGVLDPMGKKWDCPRCGSEKVEKVGQRSTPAGTIKKRMECISCNHPFEISHRSYLHKLEQDLRDQNII